MVIAFYHCVLFFLSHNSTFLLDTITLIGVLLFATAHNVKYAVPLLSDQVMYARIMKWGLSSILHPMYSLKGS